MLKITLDSYLRQPKTIEKYKEYLSPNNAEYIRAIIDEATILYSCDIWNHIKEHQDFTMKDLNNISKKTSTIQTLIEKHLPNCKRVLFLSTFIGDVLNLSYMGFAPIIFYVDGTVVDFNEDTGKLQIELFNDEGVALTFGKSDGNIYKKRITMSPIDILTQKDKYAEEDILISLGGVDHEVRRYESQEKE